MTHVWAYAGVCSYSKYASREVEGKPRAASRDLSVIMNSSMKEKFCTLA